MPNQTVETAIMHWGLRYFPASLTRLFAQTLEASGVVDYVDAWDGLSMPFPPHIWNPEDIPLAAHMEDLQSLHDPWVNLGVAAGAAPSLGLMLGGTNAIRPGPAEVMRGMMSLASATEGKFIGTVAAGEAYNCIPFGYKRSEGLRRLEDHFQLYKLLWECDGPFNFKGHFHEFKDANIGLVRTHKPTIWVEGAGPKLLDIGTTYADGWMCMVPHLGKHPEVYAEKLKQIKQSLEAKGRDPEAFGLGLYFSCFISDDDEHIQRALNSDFMRFTTAFLGHASGADWKRLGFPNPPIPDDYLYSIKYLPNSATEQETKEWINATTPEMVKELAFYGSAKEVAAQIQGFVDAGVKTCVLFDYAGGTQPMEKAPESLNQLIEVSRILKGQAS
jgi:phthiodiolone/phenolphthiodiolone dimycocerosates ketoreductase